MTQPQWYEPPRADIAPPPQTPLASGPQAEAVGFSIRAGARLVDFIAGMIVGAGAGAIGGTLVFALASAGIVGAGWEHRLGAVSLGSFIPGFFGGLAYDTLSEALGGATIGKLICGLRVLNDDDTPVTFGRALLRNIAYFVDSLFCGIVAYAVMSNSPRYQRLGDKWASTVVVRARTVPRSSARNPALGLVLGIFANGICVIAGSVISSL